MKNDHIKNGSEPASPTPYQDLTNGSGEMYCDNSGLTKREAFAMAAMQGILSHAFGRGTKEDLAIQSLECADALLKELAK